MLVKERVNILVKRLISANTSDILNFSSEELKQSIKASEGRTVLSENVVVHTPALVQDITNAERQLLLEQI